MNVKHATLAGLVCLGVFGSLTASADLKSMLASKINGAPTGAVANLVAAKDRMQNSYLASNQEWTQGMSKAAEAFGIKSDVLDQLSVVQSLSKGNFYDVTLMAKQKATDAIKAMITEKLQGGATTASPTNARQLLTDSLAHMAKGLQDDQALLKDSKGLSQQAQTALSGASLADLGKIKDVGSFATMMAKYIPSDLSSAKDLLSHLMDYAKTNNINVPPSAAGLGSK